MLDAAAPKARRPAPFGRPRAEAPLRARASAASFGLAAVVALAGALGPSTAEAASPFLVVPDPAVAEQSPAYRYANMTNDEALAELDRREIPYAREAPLAGVREPVRLTGRLHGVYFHSSLPPEERVTSMFEILDARLALALDDFAAVLERHDIDEVVHFTMYRPNVPKPDGEGAADGGAVASRPAAAPAKATHVPAALPASGRGAAAPAKAPPGAGGPRAATAPAGEKATAGKPPAAPASEGSAAPKAAATAPRSAGAPKAAAPAPGSAPAALPAPPRGRDKLARAGQKPVPAGPSGVKQKAAQAASKPAVVVTRAAPASATAAPRHEAVARRGSARPERAHGEKPESASAAAAAVPATPVKPPPLWAPPGTRHPAGLAIDVGLLHKRDGVWISVAGQFQGHIGDKTCGAGAGEPDAPVARELRSLVCEASDLGIFTYVLTPNFNVAHADHFHMEIKPGVRWFLYH